jgi:hypothetical protein
MMKGLTQALRGIGGEFEINRVVGAFGATAYVICGNAFVAYDVMWKGRAFNVTEYCLAFPGGLAVAVGAIAGAVAVKDRNVAAAKVISETNAVPAPPPAGPRAPVDQSTTVEGS